MALVLLLSAMPADANERCGDAADASLFKVASWDELGRYWERFRGCDDGYLGEHISELVSTWLARQPTTLSRLTKAANVHPALMPLVKRHINVLASEGTIARIRDNADRRCPGGSENTCREILARVQELEREIRTEHRRQHLSKR